MKAIYALYSDGHSAQQAVDGLRAAGLSDKDISVMSAQPMEDFEFGHMHSRSYIWYFACLGGIIGFAAATGLATLTQSSWPIVTGRMPIVSWWPNLIIMFELTMLGSILATVVTLILAGGLGRRRPVLYDPEVTNGKILVGVENPKESSVPDLERALQIHPTVSLKTI